MMVLPAQRMFVLLIIPMRMRADACIHQMMIIAMMMWNAPIISALLQEKAQTKMVAFMKVKIQPATMDSHVPLTLADQKDANTKTTTLYAMMELLAQKTCAILPMKMLMQMDVSTPSIMMFAMMTLTALTIYALPLMPTQMKEDALTVSLAPDVMMVFPVPETDAIQVTKMQ